jgi:hypothetical protein
MINRFCSIQYPLQAESLNLIGTDAADVVDAWHLVASSYKRTPGWIYTKVRKTESKKVEEFVPSDDTIKFYLNKFKLSYKEYDSCVKFNKSELYDELESLEKEMQSNKNL